jgi:MFS family permease
MSGALATYFGMLNLSVLLILATALGSVSAMHSPMRLALVPLLVPREALPSAVGLTAMSFNIARILGPAICATIIARAGATWAWSTPVLIFAASGFILNSLGGVGTRQKRAHGRRCCGAGLADRGRGRWCCFGWLSHEPSEG